MNAVFEHALCDVSIISVRRVICVIHNVKINLVSCCITTTMSKKSPSKRAVARTFYAHTSYI